MSDPRYRLYELRDGKPKLIAEADDPYAVGLALITIAEENREAGAPCGIVGILDWHNHRWLTSLWTSREHTPFH